MLQETLEKQSEKRKKWIQTLSVLSSEDDDFDAENMKPQTVCNFNTGQIISLRFPYPMLSDDSDEDNDLIGFSFSSNRNYHLNKKRELSSSSEETIKLRSKNPNYKYTKRKKKDVNAEKTKLKSYKAQVVSSNKENKCNTNRRLAKQSQDPAISQEITKSKIIKECPLSQKKEYTLTKPLKQVSVEQVNCKKNNGSEIGRKKLFKTRKKVCILSSPKNSNSDSDDDLGNKKNPYCSSDLFSLSSRFLESSEENSNEEISNKLYKTTRRLHVLSTSSGSSDSENPQTLSVVKPKDPRNITKSPTNKISQLSPNSLQNPKEHTITPSTNEDNDSDSYFIPSKKITKLNKSTSSTPYFTQYSFDNLINNNVNTISRTISQPGINKMNKCNSKEAESSTLKHDSQYHPRSSVSNLNTSAWTNIANIKLKPRVKTSSNRSKITDLKRKFVSSNVSTVEIHKKIKSRDTIRKKESQNTYYKKPLKINKEMVSEKLDPCQSSDVSNSKSRGVPIAIKSKNQMERNNCHNEQSNSSESNYTVNVNVFCNPSQVLNTQNERVNTQNPRLLNAPVKSNLDINLSLLGKKDTANISGPSNKKIRVSQVVKKTSQSKNCSMQPKSKKAVLKKQLDSNQIENINLEKPSEKQNSSDGLDVLSNIISQMENNPYKIQKSVKKSTEPTQEMLGWFPPGSDYSAVTGQLTQIMYKPQNEGTEIIKQNLNDNSCSLFPQRRAVPLSYLAPNSMLLSQQNTIKPKPNHEEFSNNSSSTNEKNKQLTKEIIGISDKSNTKQSNLTIPFYSAVQYEYLNKDIDTGKLVQGDENTLERSECLQQQTGSNNQNTCTQLYQSKCASLPNLLDSNKSKHFSQCKKYNKMKNCNPSTEAETNDKNQLTTIQNTKVDKNLVKVPTLHQSHIAAKTNERTQTEANRLLQKNDSKTVSKGIRIRFGGEVFRLPGKTSTAQTNFTSDIKNLSNLSSALNSSDPKPNVEKKPTNINNNNKDIIEKLSTFENNKESITEKHIAADTNELVALDSPTVVDENSSTSSSSEDSASSESEDEESSSSSEEASRDCSPLLKKSDNEAKPTGKIVEDKVNEEKNSGNVNVSRNPLTNTLTLKFSRNSCSAEAYEGNEYGNSSNSVNDDIIILSESSDSENSQQTSGQINARTTGENQKPQNITDTATLINVKDVNQINSSDLSKSSTTDEIYDQRNRKKIDNIGKIRVKSLKELGVVDTNIMLPDNALPNINLADKSLEINLQDTNEKQHKSDENSKCYKKNQIDNRNLGTQVNTPLNINQENRFESSTTKEVNPTKQGTFILLLPLPVGNQSLSDSRTAETHSLVDEVIPPTQVGKTNNTYSKQESLVQINQQCNSDQNFLNENLKKNLPSTSSTSKGTELLFFDLCNDFFNELVYLKIPKLVDDLHVSILYDVMKEERLKKIDQLTSPETIATEKRRAEKDFADMIRIRGHSFVPLFLTIVNKINKENLKALITALYCKIIHMLETIDPMNANYRFKLRHIIKSMLQKHNSGVKEEILSYFEESDENFITNLEFIEKLLMKYEKNLEECKKNQSKNTVYSSTSKTNLDLINEPTKCKATDVNDSTLDTFKSKTTVEENSLSSVPVTPSPPIGNLDQMLFKLFESHGKTNHSE